MQGLECRYVGFGVGVFWLGDGGSPPGAARSCSPGPKAAGV